MFLLLGFAFLSGLVTILAPCIWPLLPIVLSSSLAGKTPSKLRPLGVTVGVMISFSFFTLAISYLIAIFNLDPNILRIVAAVIIGILGVTMLIPRLSSLFETGISRLTGLLGVNTQNKENNFLGGFVAGLALGIIWSPCAGPILASIAALAATGQVSLSLVAVTVAYAIGVGIPLFLFSLAGQQFIKRARGLNAYTGRIQQVFGVLMILTTVAIFTNYDKVLQAKILEKYPGLAVAVNGFESSETVTKELDTLKGTKPADVAQTKNTTGLFNVSNKITLPALTGATQWLNTDGKLLTAQDLQGKVVLVDFWTYTCINCIRTLPHVTSWYDKYKDRGFVVIGVHTPEFAFERETANVEDAIKQYKINYPVPQDNGYKIWTALNNKYWPAEYLFDANGTARRVHFGEGEYDKMEQAIQALLAEKGEQINDALSDVPDETPHTVKSPETYLGTKRMQFYYPSKVVKQGAQEFKLADKLPKNSFQLGGKWNVTGEYAAASANATLEYEFIASHVFLVMRPSGKDAATVKVYLDGKLIDPQSAGKDVKNGEVTIDTDRLYDLVNLSKGPTEHKLRLEFPAGGVQAYAFTFG